MLLPSRMIHVWYHYTKAAEFRIVSVFENTQKTGCTNNGCLVAVVNMLTKAGPNHLQNKYFHINICIRSNAPSINRHTRPKCKCYSRIVKSVCGNYFTAPFWRPNFLGESGFLEILCIPFEKIAIIICIYQTNFLQIVHYLGLPVMLISP
jgi:hypothetical protein